MKIFLIVGFFFTFQVFMLSPSAATPEKFNTLFDLQIQLIMSQEETARLKILNDELKTWKNKTTQNIDLFDTIYNKTKQELEASLIASIATTATVIRLFAEDKQRDIAQIARLQTENAALKGALNAAQKLIATSSIQIKK